MSPVVTGLTPRTCCRKMGHSSDTPMSAAKVMHRMPIATRKLGTAKVPRSRNARSSRTSISWRRTNTARAAAATTSEPATTGIDPVGEPSWLNP